MKHSQRYNSQMYVDVFSHTAPLLRKFIVWQLVATSSIGHNQAIVQEHAYIQKLSTMTKEIYGMALRRSPTSWYLGDLLPHSM